MVHNKGTGIVNVVYYFSSKRRQICKSVLTAKPLRSIDEKNICSRIAYSLSKITGRKVKLTICADSPSLFWLRISLSITNEGQLQINLVPIKRSYEGPVITTIAWVSSTSNLEDSQERVTVAQLLQTIWWGRIIFDLIWKPAWHGMIKRYRLHPTPFQTTMHVLNRKLVGFMVLSSWRKVLQKK